LESAIGFTYPYMKIATQSQDLSLKLPRPELTEHKISFAIVPSYKRLLLVNKRAFHFAFVHLHKLSDLSYPEEVVFCLKKVIPLTERIPSPEVSVFSSHA
jgi:hypothetical protein